MNTLLRLLAMFLTCGVLSVGTWYFFGRERQQILAPLPTAAPKQKTTQELLVGTWRVVKFDGDEVHADLHFEYSFTADGKLRIFVEDQKYPPRTLSGTYKLLGQTIFVDIPAHLANPGVRSEITIHALTEEVLSITDDFGEGRTDFVFKRVNRE